MQINEVAIEKSHFSNTPFCQSVEAGGLYPEIQFAANICRQKWSDFRTRLCAQRDIKQGYKGLPSGRFPYFPIRFEILLIRYGEIGITNS